MTLRRSHLEAIGVIEDTWSCGPLCLVHWQNLKTPDVMSTSSPRHVWTLMIRGSTLKFMVHQGLAPR